MNQQDFFKRYQYSPKKDKLGGGTFGKVFKAYDTVRNRYVAVKVAEVIEVGDKTLSLQDELNAVSNLPDHVNIAYYEQVYQFETPQGDFDYAIMQYYPDGSLAGVLEKENLSFEQKEQIAQGILDGVAFLHKHKVTHRDLKPANILIVKHQGKYIPKIADFGLSKQAEINDKSFFENSIKGGTIAYSSPEQLLGRSKLHLNTDIWSVGVILYSMFTGSLPFNATEKSGSARDFEIQKKILQAPIPDAVNSIPAPYNEIITQCLEKDPNKRVRRIEHLFVPHAEVIADESTKVQETTTQEKTKMVSPPPFPKPPPIKQSTPPSAKKNKGVWIGAIVALMLLLGVFAWQYGTSPRLPHDDEVETEPVAVEIETFTETVNGTSFKMIAVEGGSFDMGSNDGRKNERPVHSVSISDFYMGETEVTHKQYIAFLNDKGINSDGSYGRTKYVDMDDEYCAVGYRNGKFYFKGNNLAKSEETPMMLVTWSGAKAYCDWLREKTGKEYRLPSEAEWEYAARGGNKSRGYTYAGSNNIDEVAWYSENSYDKGKDDPDFGIHKVATNQANELGLYDMNGNVREWCEDKWHDSYQDAPTDGSAWTSGSSSERIMRGGNWYGRIEYCRLAYRFSIWPDASYSGIGFRLALSIGK